MHDLQNFFLPDHADFTLHYVKFDLKATIIDLFTILASQTAINGNQFELNFGRKFPQVVVSDKNRIALVLLNLLRNAN
jgi:signal transduction histidine kinase